MQKALDLSPVPPYDGLLPVRWMAALGAHPWSLTAMAITVTLCAEAAGVLAVAKADAHQRAHFLRSSTPTARKYGATSS
jgi:hypothetical protein